MGKLIMKMWSKSPSMTLAIAFLSGIVSGGCVMGAASIAKDIKEAKQK